MSRIFKSRAPKRCTHSKAADSAAAKAKSKLEQEIEKEVIVSCIAMPFLPKEQVRLMVLKKFSLQPGRQPKRLMRLGGARIDYKNISIKVPESPGHESAHPESPRNIRKKILGRSEVIRISGCRSASKSLEYRAPKDAFSFCTSVTEEVPKFVRKTTRIPKEQKKAKRRLFSIVNEDYDDTWPSPTEIGDVFSQPTATSTPKSQTSVDKPSEDTRNLHQLELSSVASYAGSAQDYDFMDENSVAETEIGLNRMSLQEEELAPTVLTSSVVDDGNNHKVTQSQDKTADQVSPVFGNILPYRRRNKLSLPKKCEENLNKTDVTQNRKSIPDSRKIHSPIASAVVPAEIRNRPKRPSETIEKVADISVESAAVPITPSDAASTSVTPPKNNSGADKKEENAAETMNPSAQSKIETYPNASNPSPILLSGMSEPVASQVPLRPPLHHVRRGSSDEISSNSSDHQSADVTRSNLTSAIELTVNSTTTHVSSIPEDSSTSGNISSQLRSFEEESQKLLSIDDTPKTHQSRLSGDFQKKSRRPRQVVPQNLTARRVLSDREVSSNNSVSQPKPTITTSTPNNQTSADEPSEDTRNLHQSELSPVASSVGSAQDYDFMDADSIAETETSVNGMSFQDALSSTVPSSGIDDDGFSIVDEDDRDKSPSTKIGDISQPKPTFATSTPNNKTSVNEPSEDTRNLHQPELSPVASSAGSVQDYDFMDADSVAETETSVNGMSFQDELSSTVPSSGIDDDGFSIVDEDDRDKSPSTKIGDISQPKPTFATSTPNNQTSVDEPSEDTRNLHQPELSPVASSAGSVQDYDFMDAESVAETEISLNRMSLQEEELAPTVLTSSVVDDGNNHKVTQSQEKTADQVSPAFGNILPYRRRNKLSLPTKCEENLNKADVTPNRETIPDSRKILSPIASAVVPAEIRNRPKRRSETFEKVADTSVESAAVPITPSDAASTSVTPPENNSVADKEEENADDTMNLSAQSKIETYPNASNPSPILLSGMSEPVASQVPLRPPLHHVRRGSSDEISSNSSDHQSADVTRSNLTAEIELTVNSTTTHVSSIPEDSSTFGDISSPLRSFEKESQKLLSIDDTPKTHQSRLSGDFQKKSRRPRQVAPQNLTARRVLFEREVSSNSSVSGTSEEMNTTLLLTTTQVSPTCNTLIEIPEEPVFLFHNQTQRYKSPDQEKIHCMILVSPLLLKKGADRIDGLPFPSGEAVRPASVEWLRKKNSPQSSSSRASSQEQKRKSPLHKVRSLQPKKKLLIKKNQFRKFSLKSSPSVARLIGSSSKEEVAVTSTQTSDLSWINDDVKDGLAAMGFEESFDEAESVHSLFLPSEAGSHDSLLHRSIHTDCSSKVASFPSSIRRRLDS